VAGEEGLLEPAKAKACGLGDAHDVPAAGDCVAEGVHTAPGVAGRRGGGGKNNAGCPDGGGDGAGLKDAHADGTGALVARAGDDGRAGGEAGEPSGFLADARADLGRFIDSRQPAFGDSRGFGHFL